MILEFVISKIYTNSAFVAKTYVFPTVLILLPFCTALLVTKNYRDKSPGHIRFKLRL